MHLTLVERRRPAGVGRYEWMAFEPDDRFTDGWWTSDYSDADDYSNVQVLLGDTEVARVELDQRVEISHYSSTLALGDQALEIQFIEVATDQRGQGIGTEVVRLLEVAYPDRRLVAFSEEADEFWGSLGWDRYLHPIEPQHYRPLFIQPARL